MKHLLLLTAALVGCQCQVSVDSKPTEPAADDVSVSTVVTADAGASSELVLSNGWHPISGNDIKQDEAKIQAIMRKFTVLEIAQMINSVSLSDKRPETVKNMELLMSAFGRLTANERKIRADQVNEKLKDL